jgi:hypothetical protein
MVFRRTSSVTHVSWTEFDTWCRDLASKIPEDKWLWAQHNQDIIAASLIAQYAECGLLLPHDDYIAEMKQSQVLKFTLTNNRLCDCAIINYEYDPRLKPTPKYYAISESIDEIETEGGIETYSTQYMWPWNK